MSDLRGGYTQDQLEGAFALVKPPGNWKMPIDANVPEDTDMALLEFAVIYFTGGGFVQTERTPTGIRVLANGYYVEVGS